MRDSGEGPRSAIWDGRFHGQHGIARFAQEVFKRLPEPPTPWVTCHFYPYSPRGSLEAGWMLRRSRSPLLVSPSFAAAPAGPYRQLLTIHDLILLDDPAESRVSTRLYFERLVRPAVRAAGMVMTVSEVSKRRIVDWAGIDPAAVVVVGNGCSVELLPYSALEDVTARFGARRPYVLFVGNGRPHKNFELLMRAVPHLPVDWSVRVVGVDSVEVARLGRAAGVDPSRWEARTHVSDDELVTLYTGAACLAVPSRSEGFGLIALEAMARGVSSAYCDSAVGEVVGTLGSRCYSLTDGAEFADALVVASERTQQIKGELVTRASQFRWEDVAARVHSAIRLLEQGEP